jgi:hypothetical protein
MEDNLKVEKWTLDDGRRAERLVEDERPLRLQQRVVEKTKPFIYERKIETVDKNGHIVEQKVESIEPKVQMQVVEHIGTTVAAQNVTEEYDCHVTKEEMIDTIVAAIKATRPTDATEQPVRRQSAFSNKLNSFGLADEVAERIEQKEYSLMDKVLIGVIIVQVIGLGYIIFGM